MISVGSSKYVQEVPILSRSLDCGAWIEMLEKMLPMQTNRSNWIPINWIAGLCVPDKMKKNDDAESLYQHSTAK